MTEDDEKGILQALQRVQRDLSRDLREQTKTLTDRIQSLADQHNNAMLEQERRNGTFAASARVEAVAEHLHDQINIMQPLLLRVTNLETKVTEFQAHAGMKWQRWLAWAAAIGGPLAVIVAHFLR